MIITHASQDEIIQINKHSYTTPQRGCLFFADEGNTYNLAGECNHQYNLDVNETIEARRFFYEHDADDKRVLSVLDMMRLESEFCDMSNEQLCELLDETEFSDEACAGWLVQQYQGILADALGYDCAESFDEQGVVYIAYCVDKNLIAA